MVTFNVPNVVPRDRSPVGVSFFGQISKSLIGTAVAGHGLFPVDPLQNGRTLHDLSRMKGGMGSY